MLPESESALGFPGKSPMINQRHAYVRMQQTCTNLQSVGHLPHISDALQDLTWLRLRIARWMPCDS